MAEPTSRKRAPARSPEEREKQLGALAFDLAERQIIEGTASSQVITHFLKAVSTRELLELERIRQENSLIQAKTEQIASAARAEELYNNAITAMRQYRTSSDDVE